MAEEPPIIFVGRNLLIAAAFLAVSYLMASYRGLPNVLIVMFALIALFTFVTTSTTIGRRIYAMGGQREGRQTLRRQYRTADDAGLREHGCAGGAWRD